MKTLEQIEEVIAKALPRLHQAEAKVAAAMLAIRDGGLYREKYATIEAYGLDRWGISRATLYRLIAQGEVAKTRRQAGVLLSQNETNPAQTANRSSTGETGQGRPAAGAAVDRPTMASTDDAQAGRLSPARAQELFRAGMDALTPEERAEVYEGTHAELKRSAPRERGGRADRLAQGERLLGRAKRVYAGLGPEAEDVLAAIDETLRLANELPAA